MGFLTGACRGSLGRFFPWPFGASRATDDAPGDLFLAVFGLCSSMVVAFSIAVCQVCICCLLYIYIYIYIYIYTCLGVILDTCTL